MADLSDSDLSGSTIRHVDLTDSRLEGLNLVRTQLCDVYLEDAVVRAVGFNRVVIRGGELADVDIHAELGKVVINGVDVGAYINDELDRRYPDRPRMRPTDPAGFREAWDAVERLWAGTVDRARSLDPALLHESVGGEWSFIETLRHLAFATDAWVRRAILGDPSPWHPLDLPWDDMPPTPGVPHDREVRPTLDEALALRLDRMATVRQVVDGLTDESLAADTVAVEGPGWPRPRSYPVQECLRIVLNEEWEHRLYAERDLDALEARGC
jgi:hypothetical protein